VPDTGAKWYLATCNLPVRERRTRYHHGVDRADVKILSRYLLSLPERVVRSLAAVSAGLIREVGEITLPPGLRRTRIYTTMVDTTLRFLIERVGEVEGAYPKDDQIIEHFLLKRTLGDSIDLAGLVAFHASPIWVFAALADLSNAGRQLIDEIVASLKAEGLLERDRKFDGVDQILDGLERTSGQLAKSLRYPPLNVQGLRKEWNSLKEAARGIPPRRMPSPDLLWRRWDELKSEASMQGRSVFELSSLIALSTVRNTPANLLKLSRLAGTATVRAGQFFAGGLLDHYARTIKEIHETGYLAYWSRELHPYLHAAAMQFSASHPSLTEKLLDKRSVIASKSDRGSDTAPPRRDALR
jgi:hypothetical protein